MSEFSPHQIQWLYCRDSVVRVSFVVLECIAQRRSRHEVTDFVLCILHLNFARKLLEGLHFQMSFPIMVFFCIENNVIE